MSEGSAGGPLALDYPVPFPKPGEGYGVGRPPFRDEQMGAWIVSSYRDVDQILRDAETFSSEHALGPQRAESARKMMSRLEEDPRISRVTMYFRMSKLRDGDGHKRSRGFYGRAFTPARVRSFEPAIRALCEQLIPPLIDRGEVEFVSELAVPLTVQVIAQSLGMPPEDYLDLKRWSDGFEGLTTPEPSDEELDAFLAAAIEFTDYITPLIEQRRERPMADMISAVVGKNDAGQRLDNEECLSMLSVLMVAGNETTTAALSGSMMYLARDPQMQAKLRADPTLIPAFVEEGLRLTAPAQALFRTATADTEVGGVKIAKGDHVYIRHAAANRDDERFDEPLCPHLEREDNVHLTFGRGARACPGAPLARAELRIALESLFERTTSIALSDRDMAVVPAGGPMTTRVGELYVELSS